MRKNEDIVTRQDTEEENLQAKKVEWEKEKRFVFEVLTRSKKRSKFFLLALVISLSHN